MIDINLFKSIPFFSNFDDKLIGAIKPFCEIVSLKKGEELLSQGEINRDLYFLIEGTTSVLIDNIQVVEVSDNGEIFGEMSIAGHTVCTATVKAMTNCQFIVFNFDRLRDLEDLLDYQIGYSIYKSISEILVQKLIATNEIAKTYTASIKIPLKS